MNEFSRLVDAWLDGEMTEPEIDKLNEYLGESHDHLCDFAWQVRLHYQLRKAHFLESSLPMAAVDGRDGDWAGDGGPPPNAAPSNAPTNPVLRVRTRGVALTAVAVTALTFVVALSPLAWQRLRGGRLPEGISAEGTSITSMTEVDGYAGRDDNSTSIRSNRTPARAGKKGVPAVRFSRSVNVAWVPEAHRWSVGDVLHQGDTVELAAGRIELVFDSGAVMTLAGPAALEIQSTDVALLHVGTATTRVENVERGKFRVITPVTEVLDLGTEFGVRVAPDGKETDVVVFEGAVDFTPVVRMTRQPDSSRWLSIGEAVRINETGDWERVVSVNSDAYPFGDSMFKIAPRRPPIIAGVTDNCRSPDSPKFYRIYRAGLDEDAQAYVDRPYEWNGVTEEGMPHFLRRADYIATFNDDKRLDDLTITVELAGPADLYLFYEENMLVPDWLAEAFEDTGFKIGLDEGERGNNPLPLGVGPGNSVDRIYSVWRRQVDRAGSVTVGPIGAHKNPDRPIVARTMMGIAAQPI